MATPLRIVDQKTWALVRSAENALPRHEAARQRIAESGAMFRWLGEEDESPWGFIWECPSCGSVAMGTLGTDAVSGWDEPRWVPAGSGDMPTLTPSLGCPNWRAGNCESGHYWLRDGQLVQA